MVERHMALCRCEFDSRRLELRSGEASLVGDAPNHPCLAVRSMPRNRYEIRESLRTVHPF